MKKILLFDCDAVCWGVFHGLPPLTHKERGTAIIYGFLNQLFSVQEYTSADRIAFIWDSRKSKRIELFPEYKIIRRSKKVEYTEEEKEIHADRQHQFNAIREHVLPDLGFSNVLMEEGFEGDDIIASIALKKRKKNRVKIVARDGDLFQLINENCVMWDSVKRQIIDEEVFFDKYGIYPDMWSSVKGICGCTTDEVPGIKGVGTTRAIDYLLGRMKSTSVFMKRIAENPDTIALTRKLVVLPFEGTPEYKVRKDHCTPKKLKDVANEYGLKSYLSPERMKQFKEYFCHGKKTPTSTSS